MTLKKLMLTIFNILINNSYLGIEMCDIVKDGEGMSAEAKAILEKMKRGAASLL